MSCKSIRDAVTSGIPILTHTMLYEWGGDHFLFFSELLEQAILAYNAMEMWMISSWYLYWNSSIVNKKSKIKIHH